VYFVKPEFKRSNEALKDLDKKITISNFYHIWTTRQKWIHGQTDTIQFSAVVWIQMVDTCCLQSSNFCKMLQVRVLLQVKLSVLKEYFLTGFMH
jgi:queuine/archaeosine tRNA-ribosyltransferase